MAIVAQFDAPNISEHQAKVVKQLRELANDVEALAGVAASDDMCRFMQRLDTNTFAFSIAFAEKRTAMEQMNRDIEEEAWKVSRDQVEAATSQLAQHQELSLRQRRKKSANTKIRGRRSDMGLRRKRK